MRELWMDDQSDSRFAASPTTTPNSSIPINEKSDLTEHAPFSLSYHWLSIEMRSYSPRVDQNPRNRSVSPCAPTYFHLGWPNGPWSGLQYNPAKPAKASWFSCLSRTPPKSTMIPKRINAMSANTLKLGGSEPSKSIVLSTYVESQNSKWPNRRIPL